MKKATQNVEIGVFWGYLGSLQITGNTTMSTYEFLLAFHTKYGPILNHF